MKRLGWIIVILLITGITVFFIGWLNIRIDAGSYAVLVSKTSGIDKTVYEPGCSLQWKWQLLFPTNCKILKFSPQTYDRTINLTGELPSGKIYSAFMAGEPDFSYSMTIGISANPKYSSLCNLYALYGINNNQTLEDWLKKEIENAANKLESFILNQNYLYIKNDVLLEQLASFCPYLEFSSVKIVNKKIPDIELYNEAKKIYFDYTKSFSDAMNPALTQASKDAANEQINIDVLKKYGELLTKYPILVDYMAIKSGVYKK